MHGIAGFVYQFLVPRTIFLADRSDVAGDDSRSLLCRGTNAEAEQGSVDDRCSGHAKTVRLEVYFK